MIWECKMEHPYLVTCLCCLTILCTFEFAPFSNVKKSDLDLPTSHLLTHRQNHPLHPAFSSIASDTWVIFIARSQIAAGDVPVESGSKSWRFSSEKSRNNGLSVIIYLYCKYSWSIFCSFWMQRNMGSVYLSWASTWKKTVGPISCSAECWCAGKGEIHLQSLQFQKHVLCNICLV